jgi:hypothetical protein
LAVIVVAALCAVGFGVRPAVALAPIRVYVFAGQSNMVGAATMAAQVPTVAPLLVVPKNSVLFWGPTTDSPRSWVPLQPPTEIWKNMFMGGFGPELSAGRSIAALHPGQHVAIMKFAWNATSLHNDWNPNRSHGLYESMVTEARIAMRKLATSSKRPLRLSGFFWMQGESDADSRSHAQEYGSNLQQFISSVRSDFHAPKLPFVMGQIDDVRRYYPVLLPYSRMVRAEQARIARADPYAFLVPTGGLDHNLVSPIHFNTRGTVELGYRFVRRSFGL